MTQLDLRRSERTPQSSVAAQRPNTASQSDAPAASFICLGSQDLNQAGSTTYNRPSSTFTASTACNNLASGCGGFGTGDRFNVYSFNVSGCTGTITVTASTCDGNGCGTNDSTTDTTVFVYQKPGGAPSTPGSPIFNPGLPCVNVISGNGTACSPQGSVTVPVCAGVFVVIVTDNLASATSGIYNLNVSATGTGTCAVNNPPTAAAGVVSGRITDHGGATVTGATINLAGSQTRKTITDDNGSYRFDNVETNGFYTVTPSRANYSFSPANRSFSLVGNQTDAGFTGTAKGESTNPLDTGEYFVRQQYLDFLGREPDEDGLNFWSNQILQCGSDTDCLNGRRRDVSAAFFISEEFQNSGFFVDRLYRAAFGVRPTFAQYLADRDRVIGGADLNASRIGLANDFVLRDAFRQAYPDSLTNEQFVNQLFDTAGFSEFTVVDRQIEIERMNNGATRADVLQYVIEIEQFRTAEYNPAFVLAEYYGYLRRDIDQAGYDFWLNMLTQGSGNNYRGMVCSFLTSTEYQRRFATVVTHGNGECGQ